MLSAGRRPYLSVVIPAFNEAARIGPYLHQILGYLDAQRYSAEVLVVCDGGQDGTADEVQRLAGDRPDITVLENGVNRGKGFSVRRGVLEAAGRVILFSDADGATPIDQFGKLRAALDAGFDVAIGSRALADSEVRVPQSWARRHMGRIFNCFVQQVVVPGIHDTQCGFKCFTREAARRIFPRLRIDRFGFDVEILWLAQKLGYRVAELPVTWIDQPNSTVHPIRDAGRMLFDVVKIRMRDLSGCYGPGRAEVLRGPRTAVPAAEPRVQRRASSP